MATKKKKKAAKKKSAPKKKQTRKTAESRDTSRSSGPSQDEIMKHDIDDEEETTFVSDDEDLDEEP